MNILTWIVLGLLSGWIASIVMRTNSQQGPLKDIFLGIIGAFLGGFLMNLLGESGVTGFNIYSIFVSVLGAVVLIFLGRSFQRI
jgi:uncharacterized membrane protein YeaQ/YmgE (transglycosylase-associated protein family)